MSQRPSPQIGHAISVVVGIFCLVMIAAAVLYYGWYAIVVMLIGLFVFAALLRSMYGSNPSNRGK